MKKLLVVATLSITVAAVIKRVARKKPLKVRLRLNNVSELISDLDSAKVHARHLEADLKAVQNWKPKFNQTLT